MAAASEAAVAPTTQFDATYESLQHQRLESGFGKTVAGMYVAASREAVVVGTMFGVMAGVGLTLLVESLLIVGLHTFDYI